MQLTPEQEQQLHQAKTAGQKRITMRMTPEQREQYRVAIAEEMAAKEENIAHLRKMQWAAQQPGFFGDVRRAIAQCQSPIHELAAIIGVEPRLLSDFRANEAELPPAALDRLIEALGLRLMQGIPQSR